MEEAEGPGRGGRDGDPEGLRGLDGKKGRHEKVRETETGRFREEGS